MTAPEFVKSALLLPLLHAVVGLTAKLIVTDRTRRLRLVNVLKKWVGVDSLVGLG